jgi:hypothetical protein
MTKVLPKPTPLSNLLIGPDLAAHTAQLSSTINVKLSELNTTLHETEQAYKDARMFDILELDKADKAIPEYIKKLTPEERQKQGIRLFSENATLPKDYNDRERAKDMYGGWSADVVALDKERRRIKAELDGYNKLSAAFTTALRASTIIDATELDLQDQRVLAAYEGSSFYPRGHRELESADIRLVVEYLRVKPQIEFELEK